MSIAPAQIQNNMLKYRKLNINRSKMQITAKNHTKHCKILSVNNPEWHRQKMNG